MKVLILDNYDSFTYNLFHYAEPFCDRIDVRLNDQISIEEINDYDKIIISPGPGLPEESGILMDLLKTYSNTKPILGVCLGLQAIVEFFGGSLYNLDHVLHGKERRCHIISESKIFTNIPSTITVGRYHSWAANKDDLPNELIITAQDDNDVIMALIHKDLDITAVQFHPESIMTDHGKLMIENWLKL